MQLTKEQKAQSQAQAAHQARLKEKIDKLKAKISPNLDVLEAVIELASILTSAEHIPSPLSVQNPDQVAHFFNGQRNVIFTLDKFLENSRNELNKGE